PLGERIDSDRQKDSAKSAQERSAISCKAGGLLSPDGEPQLPLDDRALGAAASGHDYPLLSGLVSDALHRFAAVSGVNLLDFQLLSGFAARTVSQNLAARASLSAIFDGARGWPDDHQHARGFR